MAFEAKCLASQRVVEVYGNLVFSDVYHRALEAVAILIDQRNRSTYKDVVAIEVATGREDSLIKADDVSLFILAIGLLGGEREVVGVAFVEVLHLRFESREHSAHVADKLHRVLHGSCFDEFFYTFCIGSIELVRDGDVFTCYVTHNLVCFWF